MKTLNLDSLATVARTLTIGGATYEVQEMTVENFIETTREAELLEKKEDASIPEQMEATIKMIHRSIPTCPESVLRKMTLEQLALVSRFLRGELDETAPKSAETAKGGAKKK